ncbi:MAG: STAS domain-containing protein [Acutalibacteraceae bacterium]|nr:STAS domain-containing protein [Acutalibacteraceae bacterium]
MRINSTGEVLTVYLQGEIDHHSAKGMREEIDRAVNFNMPSLLILDFSEVTFMDSSGIGLVMGRFKNLQKSGAKLNLSNLSGNIYKVMKLAGIDRLAGLEKGAD